MKKLTPEHKKNISISLKKTKHKLGIYGTVQTNGYREFRERSMGTMKRIYEHRLVMEIALKRSLTKDETVHHINGNKLDNRIENLQVLSKSEHARFHAKENGLGKDRVGISPKNKISEEVITQIFSLLSENKTIKRIAEITNLSNTTIKKYKKIWQTKK